MNLDDRLRNHLTEQNDELSISPAGADSVRSRSAQRKQRRAGAAAFGVVAIVLALGAAFIGAGRDDANFATEGRNATPTSLPEATETGVPVAEAELATALPEAGSALVLSAGVTDGAPGGYSLYSGGNTGGVYYVISTAPGATFDDVEFGFSPDTLYTFDGSSWNNNELSDRFVSGIESERGGVLYAVSTGSEAGPGLSVGSSGNAGQDWTWTDIDLTDVFGPDPLAWPHYAVARGSSGGEQLVIISTFGSAPFTEAFEFAQASGIDITSEGDLIQATYDGISWFAGNGPVVDAIDESAGPVNADQCWAQFAGRMEEGYESLEEVDGPEEELEGPITAEQEAELKAVRDKIVAQLDVLQDTVLAEIRAIEGCERFAECADGYLMRQTEQSIRIDTAVSELATEAGSEDEFEKIDEIYATSQGELDAWVEEAGCGDELKFFTGEGEQVYDHEEKFATWAELGITPPESWKPVQHAFLVSDGVVTDLGNPFATESSTTPTFVLDIDHDGSAWNVVVDRSTFQPGVEPQSDVVRLTSTDAQTWTSTPASGDQFRRQATLDNGTWFNVKWPEEGPDSQSGLIRSMPDGSTELLDLSDLAPDIDTSSYDLVNVTAGEYGVVAWAIEWPGPDEDGDDVVGYNSIVLYSPDGVGWGATEVVGMEVVQAVVGSDSVMIFTNNPDRAEGEPQAVLLGTA